MFKLLVGNKEWLYDGPRALTRAKFAGRLMMRRLGVRVAYIMPYDCQGETIILSV